MLLSVGDFKSHARLRLPMFLVASRSLLYWHLRAGRLRRESAFKSEFR